MPAVMRGETAADKAATVVIDNGRQCSGSVKGRDNAKCHAVELDIFYLNALFLFPSQYRTGEIAASPVINILLAR